MQDKYESVELDGEEATARLRASDEPDDETIKSLRTAVHEWHLAGDQQRALAGGETLLESLIRRHGAQDERALKVRANLAWTCRELELFERAEEHCQFLLRSAEDLGIELAPTAPSWRSQAQIVLARLCYSQGRLEESRRLDEELVAVLEDSENRDQLLACKANLATTLWKLEELDAARKLEEEVVEACSKVYGAEHPRTIQAGQNLLWTLWEQRDEEEVARRLPKLKSQAESAVDPRNQLLLSLRELEAKLARHQGRHEDSRDLEQALVDDYGSILGSEHDRTQVSRFWVAVSEEEMGNRERAIELMEDVVRVDREKWGPLDPKTLQRLERLAEMTEAAGAWERAFNHYRELLESTRAAKDGVDDEDILKILYRLGAIAMERRDRGEEFADETVAILEETLELSRKLLGPEHEQTVLTVQNLAGALVVSGSCEAGEDLYRWVHSVRAKSLGVHERETWSTLLAAGHRLLEAGEVSRAEACLQEALGAAREAAAVSDRTVQYGLDALAAALLELGRVDEAFQAHEEATAALDEAHGRSDEETTLFLDRCWHRATAWFQCGESARVVDLFRDRLGRLESIAEATDDRMIQILEVMAHGHGLREEKADALECSEKALSQLEELHGETGRETLRAKINHAYLLLSAGQTEEALDLGLETLDVQVSLYGEGDPHTLVGMSSVAMMLASCGRTEVGLPLLRRCLELRRAALAPDHPEVIATEERVKLIESRLEAESEGADQPEPKKSWWRKIWDGPVN